MNNDTPWVNKDYAKDLHTYIRFFPLIILFCASVVKTLTQLLALVLHGLFQKFPPLGLF